MQTQDHERTQDGPPAGDRVLADLRALLGDRVLTDADVLEAYRHDDAEWAPSGLPLAVVLAESAEDVAHAVRIAAREGLSVVPRGAGTGLSGGANALAGCLVVSLERMDAVLEIDADERFVVAQPGVINDALRAAVAEA